MHAILATKYFWLPKEASTVAGPTDDLFNVILWICVFFFLLVTVLLVAFVIKYRHKPGEARDVSASHSMTLELTWTIIPSIIVVFLYYYGFKEYMNLAIAPPNAYEITATGQMWQWSFTYPGGYTDPELHVPVNVPVRVVLQSDDVIHSLFIPAFRVKKDVVPGRYNRLWFEATVPTPKGNPGYDIFCADYCGTNHSTMRSHVIVYSTQKEFDDWLTAAIKKSQSGPAYVRGERIYRQMGCAGCHSVDGTRITGPSWKNLFGSTQQFADGTSAVVDDKYVHEFVANPTARIPVGYPPVMPVIPIKADQVDLVIAYMKTITVHYHPSLSATMGAGATTRPTTGPTTKPAAKAAARSAANPAK